MSGESYQSECSQQAVQIEAVLAQLSSLPSVRDLDFDFGDSASVSDARVELLRVRERLAELGPLIHRHAEDAAKLSESGVETLSPDQYHALKDARQRLLTTYKSLVDSTDAVLRRLDIATDLLIQFANLSSEFQSWIFAKSRELESLRRRSGYPDRVVESRREHKVVVDSIYARESELRDIGQLAVKIECEIRAYLDELKRSDPNATHPPLQADQVQDTVQRLYDDYERLKGDTRTLDHFLARLKSLSIDHDHNVNDVAQWLGKLERALRDADIHAADRPPLDELLQVFGDLNEEAIGNQAKVDAIVASSKELVEATAATDAHDDLAKQQDALVSDVKRRFDLLNSKINDNLDAVRSELSHKEGVKAGLSGLRAWLDDVERDYARAPDLPLVLDKLNDLKYEEQLMLSGINSHAKVFDDLEEQVEDMKDSAPGVVAAEGLEADLAAVKNRLVRLKSGRNGLHENLLDVIKHLGDFNAQNDAVGKQLLALSDEIDRATGAGETLDDDGMQRMRNDLAQISAEGIPRLEETVNTLLGVPNVTEQRGVTDALAATKKAFARVQQHLDGKVAAAKTFADEKSKFAARVGEVEEKLTGVEKSVAIEAEHVPVDLGALAEQRARTDDLSTKLDDICVLVDGVERLGTSLLQASGANKRRSVDLEGEGAAVTRQVFGLRHRHDEAVRQLRAINDRADSTADHHRKWQTRHDELARWLAQEQAQLAKRRGVNLDKESVKSIVAEGKAADARVTGKEPELVALRSLFATLLDGKQPSDPSMTAQQEALEAAFPALKQDNAALEQLGLDAKAFLDDGASLGQWIGKKTQVLDICRVSAEPAVVADRLTVLNLLKNEIADEQPKWQGFNDRSDGLLQTAPNEPFGRAVAEHVDSVNKQWTALDDAVSQRIDALEKAKQLGLAFDAAQKALRNDLGSVERAVMDAAKIPPTTDAEVAAQLVALERIAADLDAVKTNRASELEKITADLMEAVDPDGAAQSDISSRLEAAKSSIGDLDRRIAGVLDGAREAKGHKNELLVDAANALDWIEQTREDVDALPSLSADPAKLSEQLADLDPIHQVIGNREGAMLLMRAKLAEAAAANAPGAPAAKDTLVRLNDTWEPLLADVKRRHGAAKKAKKLVDEADALDKEIRAGLEAAAHALEEAKASGQPGDTKPVEEALAVLRPKRELLSTTLTKLEALAPGADAKKLRREADNLETDIKDLAKAAEALEKSAGQKNDLLKQLEGSLEGVRGLLASTRASAALDESEGVGKQPVLTKERLRVVIDDLQSKYGRQLGALESAVAALKPFTDDKDKEQIDDEVDELKHAFNELTEQLAVQHDKLLHAENAADEKTAHSNALRSEIDDLADQIRDLRPVECDLEALEKQKTECHDLAAALAEKENALQTLAIEWKALVESGNVPAGAGSVSRDLDALKQKLTAQKKRLADREWAIDETAKQLTGLEKDVEARLAELDAIVASEVLSEPVASEPVDLRRQLTALGQFKANDVKPVAKAVGDVIASCQQLLRNAGSGVPTDLVERQMANVTERLADVNGVVDGRERLLERALNDLGSFNDAYRALLNWIEEIEELVANQKPPSADFKVAKAQLQSHDFQLKSIDEKQSSVENLVKRAQTLSADEQLKATYQKQAENIASRYKALVDDTNSRRMQLLNASMLGEVFAGHFAELSQWLDATERNVQALVNVATDCDVLNEQIERRKELEAEIDDQRANFDELNRVAQELMFLVGADDAVEVQTKAQALSNRYDHLGYRCHALEGTLADIADSVATFLEDANRLDGWLVEADSRLADFDDLPVTPDELVAQSQELADLVSTIAEQQDLVSRVVQDSSELCEHALGNEALVLQSKIEDLKRRYAQLSNESDRRITAMAEALPLSEEVHNAFDDLSAFVAECESDLANVDQLPPDEQQQVIAQLASDAASAGVEMDDLAQKCIQLQHLCSRQKAADLARQAAELKRAVDVLSDKVARKEGDLQSADRQSRQVFDDLDYLIDWFQEARAKVLSLEKPSTELERLQKQLRNQRLMNDDIAKEKADLREIIATATRVARELKTSLGGQELAIASKIEQVKELAEETMRLGRERVEDLEQALELSRDLVDSYDDINRWLEIKGAELESAASITTTTPAEELIAMKRHNDAVLQQYRDQKHILAKFQRNVANLAELCAEDDAQNLAEIADAIVRRFYDQEQEFTRRGRIIEDILDSSAQLGDRLDSMLVNLENETSKIRNAEPPSAQPPLLLRQISDNEALAALFANRQGYFADLKSDAADVLSQLSPNDPSSGQIAAKLVSLDALWVEIQDGLARRHHLLHDTLAKAERFWAELESTKAAVDGIKRNLDAIHMTAADPEKLKENEVILGQVNAGIDDTANAIASLQRAGSTLAGNVGPEDRQQVEQTMDAMEHKWATVTAIYAQMSANLVDAISKSANFHELLRDLLAWLDAMEAKVAALPPPVLADVARIQADQADLAALRSAVDLKAVAREQLTLAADHLYANAHPTQVAAVRQPMNVLNARWNHLYEALNDRQQALERALLEMGQFSEAYEQLVTWIDKTDATLDEIDIGATDTSHIEVQLCKLKVLENDTQAHTPSFEAIMRVGKAADSGDGRVAVLADKWGALTDKLGRLWTKLEISKNAASNRDGELNRWALWLDDILSEVTNTRPIGGLPETAREQLENYQIILADVEEKRPGFEAQLAILAAGASEGYVEMQRKWARANEKLVDRQKKLQIALAEAEALAEAMQAATRWLDAAENRLNNAELISRLPERVTEQSADHDAFVADVARQREAMSDLHATGTKIQFTCEKKDAIPIKNRLISLKHRFDKVANRTTDRTKALAHAAGEAAAFFEAAAELNEAAQEAVQQLASLPTIDSATGDVIRDQLYAVKDLRDGLVDKKPKFEQTEKRGYQLAGHAPSAEKVRISDAVNSLSKKWKETNAEAAAKQQALEDALAQSGKFDDALNTAFKWLDGVLPDIEAEVAEGKAMGTLNAVTALHNELGNLKKEKQQKEAGIAKLKERAQQIINSPDGNDGADRQRIAGNLAELEDKWQRLQKAIDAKDGLLGDAMVSAVDFDEAVIDLEQRAASADALLRKTGVVLPDDEPGTQLVLKQLDDFKIDIETSAKPDLATTIELGEKLLAGAHPAAEDDVKSVLRKLRALWDQIDQNLEDKTERARKHLGDLQEHSKSLDALEDFISAKEGSVAMQEAEEEPSTVLQVDHLTAEHELFKSELAEQQPAVDEAVKTAKRMAAVPVVVDANGNQSGSSPTTPTKSPSKTVPPLLRATSTVGGRNKALQTPEKRRSKRTQRTDGIADRWRKLQEFAAAFDAKLKERRETLTELDRLKDFKFENWRGRYLAWNDHGKARVSDLFRRIDKSRTGLIPRKDLINGILASSFPTTRLEMERVADVFDKGDGFISSKEFMNALRHDPKKLQVPRTEAEMIHDELKKEEERCTCKHKFPIKYEGTNNNRVLYNFGFGGTTKRLVRILRSNVMVRVGGGWEELGAFLEKHDPCRAAGRMNVNIYSANTPDPSQDRMYEFKTRKPSVREVMGYADGSLQAPISKIREKTERSVPMFKKPYSRENSFTSYVSSRRGSDLHYSESKIPRPSPSVSRSGSRMNLGPATPVSSRPPSRMSEASDERTLSRIPSLRGAKTTTTTPAAAATNSSRRPSFASSQGSG